LCGQTASRDLWTWAVGRDQARDQEPVGGADRFVTVLGQYKHLNPLVLFSGDVFAPSNCACPIHA
jgi:hypothetical protein